MSSVKSDGHKVFFDISSLVDYIEKSERYSGIQRVVVELVADFSEVVDTDQIYLSWCDGRAGRMRCTPLQDIGTHALKSPIRMGQIFHPNKLRQTNLPLLKRYEDQPAKYYFHRTRLDVMALLKRESRFRKRNMTSEMWLKARRARTNKTPKVSRPSGQNLLDVAQAGDHLVLLDSSWLQHHIKGFKAAHSHGMVVHSMVHDLIPIVASQYTGENLPYVFYDWILGSQDYISRYMTNSIASRRDLLQFFEAHGIDQSATAIPLAQAGLPEPSTMAATNKDVGPIDKRISFETYPHLEGASVLNEYERSVVGSSYALCVGTIEARKNIWRLAMAWKYLAEKGYPDIPRLVFAGGWGCLTEDFKNLMKATGNIYGYAHVIEKPSDDVLRILYKNCKFTLMPSLYEGWGLPVGEAIAYGKTAVVGDNSSLPEVGGDLVEYCDAHSIKSIADAVLRINEPERLAELEEKIKTAELRSWADVARDMARAIYAPS